MIKTVGIVSLSAGTIGENFVRHELEIGVKRLETFGLKVKFLPNALKGRAYVSAHPEKRAEDLLEAFNDDEIDMILCAIGGDDTYRLTPYLFENDQLKKAVKDKIFLGFSDSTVNHFMLHRVGLNTFYGQSFLADICDIGKDMPPYSKKYFLELINEGTIKEIAPSEVWYENRKDYSVEAIGTELTAHENSGFELLQGKSVFSGKILGGCIDTIYDMFDNGRYEDSAAVCQKYELFPAAEQWKGKILLLETSEVTASPQLYRKMLAQLKNYGIFDEVSGVIVGKPMNKIYFDEYKSILKEVIADENLPVVVNISIGHALPRCIIPLGRNCIVDVNNQKITFTE